jgi:acyl carrier protein
MDALDIARNALFLVLLPDDEDSITPSARLGDDLDADSLDRAEMQLHLEEMGILIPDEEAERWTTVADMVASIERHRVAQ